MHIRHQRSPIAALPAELLLHVIEDVVQEDPILCLKALVILTSVCRSWRSMMLYVKSLWTTLSFTLPRQAGPLLYEFARRSYPCPLHIIVTIYGGIDASVFLASVMEVLRAGVSFTPETPRLHQLHLRIGRIVRTHELEALLRGLGEHAFATLTTLRIERFMDVLPAADHERFLVVDAFSLSSSALHTVRLSNVFYRGISSSLFRNLTVLKIYWVLAVHRDEGGWSGLAGCQKLRELWLHFRPGPDGYWSVQYSSTINLPLLRKLVIHSMSRQSSYFGAMFLRNLHCPRLETLLLICSTTRAQCLESALMEPVRVYPCLTTLTVESLDPDQDLSTRFPMLDRLILRPAVQFNPTTSHIDVLEISWILGSWPRRREVDIRSRTKQTPGLFIRVQDMPAGIKPTLKIHSSARIVCIERGILEKLAETTDLIWAE